MKKNLRAGLWITVAVTSVVLLFWQLQIFRTMENRTIDLRFRWRGAQPVTTPILIAKIDDDALAAFGKWPWPRQVHARFVDACRRAGAAAVAIDVLFYEPDARNPENDEALGRAIRRSKKVAGGLNFSLHEEQVAEQSDKGTVFSIKESILQELPIPAINETAAAMGFVNSWPDLDGVLRRGVVSFMYEGAKHYPINLLTVALGEKKEPEDFLKNISIKTTFRWNQEAQETLINWRGSDEAFKSFSCADIINEVLPAEWLKGKIIILGSTALGLYDHYPTPFSTQLPGVYYHATMMDNFISQEFLKPTPTVLTVFLIVALGLAFGFAASAFNAWVGLLLSFAGILAFWLLGIALFSHRWVLELTAPSFSIGVNYLSLFFYRFIVEQKEKAGIKKAFGVYVNPHIVEQIAKNPEALKLGGESREMSVMFSDVAGFTSISEKLSPEELVQLLNLYLTAMTETIMRYEGTVDKYEGDAIMAFWGAPLQQERHATLACLAVLENREKLIELNAELSKKGMQKLAARCGINTGLMNVGNMGSTQKFNYTVMGDAVNLASRLEGANKAYGSALMISESTYVAAKDAVEVRELDLLRVKGKLQPIRVYELISKKGDLHENQKRGFELFLQGLELYRTMKFTAAEKKFHAVFEFLPEDPPTQAYLERCQAFLENPPESHWDGVFVMTTK